jgi:hypothetical protein
LSNVRGANPKLMLYDEDEVLREEVGIEKWKLEQIHSFLKERLADAGWWEKLMAWSASKQGQRQIPTFLLVILGGVLMLSHLIFPEAAIVYERGDKVVLHSLKKGAEYNGCVGIVVALDENGRVVVRLAKDAPLKENKGAGKGDHQEGSKKSVPGQEPEQLDEQAPPQQAPSDAKLLKIRPDNLRIFDDQVDGKVHEQEGKQDS